MASSHGMERLALKMIISIQVDPPPQQAPLEEGRYTYGIT